jgi:spore protease
MAFQAIDVQTDMAVEARELVRGRSRRDIPGVHVHEEQRAGIVLTRVHVKSAEAARLMGKPVGHYITIDVPQFKDRDSELRDRATQALAEVLTPWLARPQGEHVLVVGLGNWNATPDALGPRVVDRLLVTRHLEAIVPKDIRDRMRRVSAVAPGVLGTTGIETVDIIRGIVREARPDRVVAVDALAARSPKRLVASIQVADTGIHPGSGVGNRRQGITQDTVGVPVIAIGVPTVVLAAGMVVEAVERLVATLKDEAVFHRVLHEMEQDEQRRLIDEVMGPELGSLMVTPKEIDVLINDMADVVSEALNQALQPDLDRSEWA